MKQLTRSFTERREVIVFALGCALLLSLLNSPLSAQQPDDFRLNVSEPLLSGVPFELEVEALDAEGNRFSGFAGEARLHGLSSGSRQLLFDSGVATLSGLRISESGISTLRLSFPELEQETSWSVRVIPGFLSILPPLLAIALALALRQVVLSLFAGIWLGAVFAFDYQVLAGFFRVLDHFIVNAMNDRSHAQIILFSMLFGGMVGVMTQNGGARGIANLITRYATTAKGGQLAAWGMAFVLFFDDYANVLIRGNLMRPITDRLRVSREKLAFLVDTGAATVASIFIISTWIGYEVGLIEQGLRIIGSDQSAYTVFIQTIPYRFYPILALILAFVVVVSGRDIGPMWEAERRSRFEGKVMREGSKPATDLSQSGELADDVPARWINGILPVVAILVVGLFGLYHTGSRALQADGITEYGVGAIMSSADSYVALLWASLAGCVVAIFLSVSQRILGMTEAIEAWVQGLKAMLFAMLILILAWSLGAVTEELHTADYLVQILRGVLSPYWLPPLTFVIAAAVAFSTGTSWATMAIMMPLVIPLAHTLGMESGLAADDVNRILLGVISSVLAGAVFGDHCSPISDTTILSSMSSSCDHIDHVRTQLPYALLAGTVGILVGDIPTAYGCPVWISLVVGTLLVTGAVFLFGRKIEA